MLPIDAVGKSHTRASLSVVTLLVLAGLAVSSRPAAAAVRGPFDVGLVNVRFSDTTPRFTTAQLNTAADEMHRYYAQLSQGNLDLRFRVVNVTLTRPWADYCHVVADVGDVCSDDLAPDVAQAAAAAGLDVSGLEAFLIVRGGCNYDAGSTWPNRFSIDRPGVRGDFWVSVDVDCSSSTSLPSGVGWGGWAHELGHQLEFHDGHSVGQHPSGYSSGYNLMDSCYPCGESPFDLVDGSLTNETGAMGPKQVFPGWIPADRVRVVTSTTGSGETVVLSPVSDDLTRTTAAHGIKIPLSLGQYYFVEARRRLRSDGTEWTRLYDEGVAILRIDESAGNPATVVNSCDAGGCLAGTDPACAAPGRTGDTAPRCWPFALFHPGNAFNDAANSVRIAVGPPAGNGFPVTVTRGVPAGTPDLYVTPWLTPPMNTWETIDLWVDSSCNGYESDGGTLRFGRRPDGTVVANGDSPCANHPNRLYAKVRNTGGAPANDVRVRFDVTEPLGVGITGSSGWRTIGTVTSARFPELASLAAGRDATIWIEWTPTVDLTAQAIMDQRFAFHSCFRVVAAPVAGERVTSNLDGDGEQENIDQFEVGASRRAAGMTLERSMRVMHPGGKGGNSEATFWFAVDSALPPGWSYQIAGGARSITLRPGESRQVPVRITPAAGNSEPGSAWHLRVNAFTMVPQHPIPGSGRIEMIPLFGGGVDFSAQAVLPTRMTATAAGAERGKVVVTGSIDPPVASAWITIDYIPKSGPTISRLVRTDARGAFRDEFAPSSPDGLRVRAFWTGSAKQASATTAALEVRSGGASNGVPGGMPMLAAVVLLLLLLLLAAWLARRRRRSRA
jgi:hypothetical protein